MEIRLFEEDSNLERNIRQAADSCNAVIVFNSIGWRERQTGLQQKDTLAPIFRCSFRLNDKHNRPASSDTHDKFFELIFAIYPEAEIKTGRVIYEDKIDFEAQKAARVP